MSIAVAAALLALLWMWWLGDAVTVAGASDVGADPMASLPEIAPRVLSPPRSSSERSAPAVTSTGEGPEPAPTPGRLLVRVVDDQGRPEPGGWASAVGCPLTPLAPVEGFLTYAVAQDLCVVRGARQDGQLTTYGPEVTIAIPPGGVVSAELVVPSERTGAMQLALERVDEGLLVRWAPEPERDGVGAGDVITAIEGTPVADMTTTEAVELLRGPVGTEVRVEVLGETDTSTPERVLVRRAIQ